MVLWWFCHFRTSTELGQYQAGNLPYLEQPQLPEGEFLQLTVNPSNWPTYFEKNTTSIQWREGLEVRKAPCQDRNSGRFSHAARLHSDSYMEVFNHPHRSWLTQCARSYVRTTWASLFEWKHGRIIRSGSENVVFPVQCFLVIETNTAKDNYRIRLLS